MGERTGTQGIALIVQIILARILAPEVYGIIALVSVFISLLNVFIDSGFANALIQKKKADDLDFSTVFYFNIFICLLLYIIMFFSAPIIARFYNNNDLILIIRVLSLTLIISGIKNIQLAYISKNMLFKKLFFATFISNIFSVIISIILAYKNYGVWALVFQQLTNTFFSTCILWVIVEWKPSLIFSFNRLKNLFDYGWKLLISNLIDVGYLNLRQLVIGKFFTPKDLAFYNRGHQFPELIVTNVNNSIDSVLFPTMSKAQDCKEEIKSMTRKSIKMSTYIMAPLMIGMACMGDCIISLILTDKWLPCVFYLRIFCITYLFYPIHTANLNAIKSIGKSDCFLKLEIIKKVFGVCIMIIALPYGVKEIAYSVFITTIFSMIINSLPNKKLINYGYFEQIKDIFPNLFIAVIMGIIIFPIKYIGFNNFLTLIFQIVIGIIVFISISKILKNDMYYYILEIINNKNNRG